MPIFNLFPASNFKEGYQMAIDIHNVNSEDSHVNTGNLIQVNFVHKETKEVIFSYRRTEILELLSTLKQVNRFEIETEQYIYKLQYANSFFKIKSGNIEEILNIYLNIIDIVEK
jgi:hypothetical protein